MVRWLPLIASRVFNLPRNPVSLSKTRVVSLCRTLQLLISDSIYTKHFRFRDVRMYTKLEERGGGKLEDVDCALVVCQAGFVLFQACSAICMETYRVVV